MPSLCRSLPRLIRAACLVALMLPVLSSPLQAVDTAPSEAAPDLAGVRAKIKTKAWAAAILELKAMLDRGIAQADVYNLMGFSLRKSGDLERAYTFYRKALEYEPNHKGALEYLGELYVERGELAKAREHVRLLTGLCPSGCEELDDLKAALAQADGGRNTN